jgi:HD domain
MPVEGSPLPKLESRFRGFLAELDRCEGFVAGHSVAVCKTALRLAEELGVPAEELPGVALGALMHDIGKVFVDGRLLGKPVPLTRAELETIRLHPQLGEALLAPTVSHALVLGIVRWHHERWDGGGYPDRLEGAATPLGARIVARRMPSSRWASPGPTGSLGAWTRPSTSCAGCPAASSTPPASRPWSRRSGTRMGGARSPDPGLDHPPARSSRPNVTTPRRPCLTGVAPVG